MSMNKQEKNSNSKHEYRQYNDYIFRRTVEKRANGVLKFLKIPYTIKRIIQSEVTDFGPHIHRLDFAGEAQRDGERKCIILECQSNLPTDYDITCFFQYVSSLRVMKNLKVELYILCTKKAPYTKKEYVIDDDCIYTMHVISLKEFRAEEILKKVENKIRNNDKISDEDIASLQLIAYTRHDDSTLEILLKAAELVKEMQIEENEKRAILYILDVLSANMLDEDDKKRFLEETKMNINPRDEYLINQGKQEGIKKGKIEGKIEEKLKIAQSLIKDGMSIEKVMKITELTKEQIQNAK